MILGIDAGNYETKVCDGAISKFPSALGEWRDLSLRSYNKYDFEYEYKGIKGFGGTLAKRESQLAFSKLGDTKAHEDALIRILLACSLYDEDIQLVTGQPIKSKADKQKIKDMLLGTHKIKINGVDRKITISAVEVATECASFYTVKPVPNVTIIDMGAGTINVAVIKDTAYFVDERTTQTDE